MSLELMVENLIMQIADLYLISHYREFIVLRRIQRRNQRERSLGGNIEKRVNHASDIFIKLFFKMRKNSKRLV